MQNIQNIRTRSLLKITLNKFPSKLCIIYSRRYIIQNSVNVSKFFPVNFRHWHYRNSVSSWKFWDTQELIGSSQNFGKLLELCRRLRSSCLLCNPLSLYCTLQVLLCCAIQRGEGLGKHFGNSHPLIRAVLYSIHVSSLPIRFVSSYKYRCINTCDPLSSRTAFHRLSWHFFEKSRIRPAWSCQHFL